MKPVRGSRPVLWLGITFLAGCASTQRLSIRTEPSGAHAYLQRRGEVEVRARVEGVFGKIGVDSFEEEFFSLGTTPVDFEFDRSETEAAVHSPDAGGNVKRRYREGTVRVEMEGYQTAERRLRFSGSAIDLMITLLPVQEEP